MRSKRLNYAQDSERPVPTDLLADVLWRRVDETSLEHFRLVIVSGSYTLHGVVLSWAESSPLQVHYVVACDLNWNTTAAHVTAIHGDRHSQLELERDESGTWRNGSEPLTGFDGIVDIDLEITPATNTLPIRRLELDVGDAAQTDALWVRFPELTLERLPQRYSRVADRKYSYESHGGTFRADLDVDSEGVVIRYDDIWERVRT
jgi:uncharacterized protein